MEASAASTLSHFNLRRPLSFSSSSLLSLSSSQSSTSPSLSFSSQFSNCFSQRKQNTQFRARQLRNLKPIEASASSESPSSESTERWLLEPIGDGDTRHIGFRVPLPNAFEIASNVVTVGRLPQKADVVIPVATVSGVHARLEKKGGALLVTDLDSTNGTYVDDKKLSPGAVTAIPPGSCLTFGDIHLAIFRVLKLEKVDPPGKSDESEITLDADAPTESVEATS